MDVDLPVFDGVKEVFNIVLVSQRSPVVFQSAVDFNFLLGSQELGTNDGVSPKIPSVNPEAI